jgi:LmbE family N-acetylglucosaminyl deacetylase
MDNAKLRLMAIVPHQDDFEFNAGGLFATARKHYQDELAIKILATTRGASGHHEMSLDETFKRRDREAKESAAIIGAGYECLTLLDGTNPEGQLFINKNSLGGIWNSIRCFAPDIIFCPPLVTDPLAGIHIDHLHTAQAVRAVAYQLCVPHAYPVTQEPFNEKTQIPIIVNMDDVYAAESDYCFCCDISGSYKIKEQMSECHKSQIYEWLPFTQNEAPPSVEEWKEEFRMRHKLVNQRYGVEDDSPLEFFKLTRWGKSICIEDVQELLPFITAKRGKNE